MASPIFLTGYEHGVMPNINGGGLAGLVQGPTLLSISSTEHNSGNYSLRCAPVSALTYVRYPLSGPPTSFVGRVYFKLEVEPSSPHWFFDVPTTTGAGTTCPRIYISPSTNVIELRVGTTIIATSPNTYTVGQWQYVDFYFDVLQNPWVLKARLNGGTEFSGNSTTAGDSFLYYRMGAIAGSSPMIIYYDDLVVSTTLADYPFGAGGTELLVPDSSDGTNAGVNTIEEEDGTDVGASSYLALNSVPMGNGTKYIRQFTLNTNAYMAGTFANISATHSGIIGAIGLLAYTASGTAQTRGATIISKDGFSSFTTIFGNPTTPTDYSDGTTSDPWWKSAIIAGAVDDTTINALAFRIGYSSDVIPMPYWIDLGVEVAYTTSSGPQTYYKTLSGALGFSGGVLKQTTKVSTATLSFSGTTLKKTSKVIAGILSFSANVLTFRTISVVISGALSFSGTVSKKTSKLVSGALSFSGSVIKKTTKLASGVMSFSGSVVKKTTKLVSGSITLSGSILRSISKVVGGSLTFAGALTRTLVSTGVYQVVIGGSISFAGSLSKSVTKITQGTLSMSGSTSKTIFKMFSGELSMSGSVLKTTFKIFSGALSFTKSLFKILSGVIFPTPRRRTLSVNAETRTYCVLRESRTAMFGRDARGIFVREQDRVIIINKESRIHTIGEEHE